MKSMNEMYCDTCEMNVQIMMVLVTWHEGGPSGPEPVGQHVPRCPNDPEGSHVLLSIPREN
jgi:hypothetical protein